MAFLVVAAAAAAAQTQRQSRSTRSLHCCTSAIKAPPLQSGAIALRGGGAGEKRLLINSYATCETKRRRLCHFECRGTRRMTRVFAYTNVFIIRMRLC